MGKKVKVTQVLIKEYFNNHGKGTYSFTKEELIDKLKETPALFYKLLNKQISLLHWSHDPDSLKFVSEFTMMFLKNEKNNFDFHYGAENLVGNSEQDKEKKYIDKYLIDSTNHKAVFKTIHSFARYIYFKLKIKEKNEILNYLIKNHVEMAFLVLSPRYQEKFIRNKSLERELFNKTKEEFEKNINANSPYFEYVHQYFSSFDFMKDKSFMDYFEKNKSTTALYALFSIAKSYISKNNNNKDFLFNLLDSILKDFSENHSLQSENDVNHFAYFISNFSFNFYFANYLDYTYQFINKKENEKHFPFLINRFCQNVLWNKNQYITKPMSNEIEKKLFEIKDVQSIVEYYRNYYLATNTVDNRNIYENRRWKNLEEVLLEDIRKNIHPLCTYMLEICGKPFPDNIKDAIKNIASDKDLIVDFWYTIKDVFNNYFTTNEEKDFKIELAKKIMVTFENKPELAPILVSYLQVIQQPFSSFKLSKEIIEGFEKIISLNREAAVEYAQVYGVKFKIAENLINSINDHLKNQYSQHLLQIKNKLEQSQKDYMRKITTKQQYTRKKFFIF